MKKYFLILIFLSSNLLAQDDKWTPEDIINTEYVSSPVFSPDGNIVIWSKSKGDKEKDKFIRDLYLTRLNAQKDGKPHAIALTKNEHNDYNPVFSEDGETIYFLSSREEGKKLWSISIYGGEAQEVYEFKNGISNIDRLDPNTLVFVSKEGKSLYEQEKEKDNTIVIEDEEHWKINRLYTFDLKDKKINRFTQNDFPVSTYAISKDGNYIVTGHTMSLSYAADARVKPKFYLHNLQTNTKEEILQGIQQPGSFNFDQQSNGFYFINNQSTDPEWNGAGIYELNYFDLQSMKPAKVNLNWENGIGRGYEVAEDGVIVSLASGATNKLVYYQKKGNQWTNNNIDLNAMNEHVDVLAMSPQKDKVIIEHSTASQLPEYYFGDLQYRRGLKFNNLAKFTELNEGLKKKTIAKSEVIRWAGAKDETVEGILYYPKNYEEGKKYPLILSIHGGPSGVDLDAWRERWSTYPQIYTQKDAFVLKPNYHGSSNYGLAFVESIKLNYYDLEMVDIINGIDHLNEKGFVDMDKLGVMGWSNGAILTTMLTVRYPDMFKAAAPGAGDVNWTSDFGTCRFGVSFDQSYFGGAPWDNVEGKTYNPVYIEKSPLFEMEKVKTPTIIFHGSEDRAVPRDQGWEYYRALQQIAQAPVKFLWFPGQPHGLQKITHQLRKMNEEINWFDRYLFKTYDPVNEAFKKDSPLAYRFIKDSVMLAGDNYGIISNNALLPEMVELGEDTISISRFEITNAQYAAYEKDYSYEPGKGDYPVTGLNEEQINEYISWLSATSGENYRLPNADEAKSLQKAARKNYKDQNNLNYWAGYDITWDEIADFKEKLKKLQKPLLEPVGERKPVKVSGEWIYGIGGNVAEYHKADGELKIYDYSAYDYVDPFDEGMIKESGQVGFRVVK